MTPRLGVWVRLRLRGRGAAKAPPVADRGRRAGSSDELAASMVKCGKDGGSGADAAWVTAG